ncbi:MFS transporter, DHA1 family, bicyclomycin/chloramphenicol resistance protein [Prauserella marina]|uniref:MFS transporter, DHA1 family, bicyclomycin/chloramphenicol resistance protein n=2 Tax=Prauserella marina TaxID=530584 RepID=A0A1G6IES5_9PSEU|nr:DHA1 family bicyclomycin/chloramphenicol resistance-like MFS transporter [Prauserella marina]SDC04981.1 MFS transporter, DHA1 family, bicyclomycin/chloramphenicol resistance protein [Prauserella marina]
MSVEQAPADGELATRAGAATMSPTRAKTVRFALILGGLTAFGPLAVDMYLPALPAMATDLASSDSALQLTLAAFVVGMGVGQLVAGPLSDAFGRRTPLLVGVVVFALASVLCAIAPSAELLIGARVVQALGASAGVVIARAAVRDLFSGIAMARFFSALMLVTGLAPILAPVLGGQILNWTSWRGIFAVLTGFGVLLLVVTAFALPESLPAHARRPARPSAVLRTYAGLLGDRVFVGYALACGLTFAAMFTYISGSSFVLQGAYELSPQQYSLVFAAGGLGLVIVGQLNGWLVGRFPQRSLLLSGLLLGVSSSSVLLLAASANLGLGALLPPLLLTISSLGMIMPNATSLALADHPHNAGAASALLGVLQFLIGGLVATPLAGIGGGTSAVPMAAIMAGFGLLGLLSFAVLARPTAAAPVPAA